VLSLIGALLVAPFWNSNPSSYIPLLIGLICNGFASAFSVIPNIPYTIEVLTPIYNDPELKSSI